MKKTVVILMILMSFALAACGHEHIYAESWSYDEVCHWHRPLCDETHAKGDIAEHEFSPDGV